MGIILPDTQPQLIPTADYLVLFQSYSESCGFGDRLIGFRIKTGAVLQAWLNAGNNCKIGADIFSGIPGWTGDLLALTLNV